MHSLRVTPEQYEALVMKYEGILQAHDQYTWRNTDFYLAFFVWIKRTYHADVRCSGLGLGVITFEFENEQDLIWFELKV